MPEEEKKSSAMKYVGIGCLVVVLVVVIGGYVAYIKLKAGALGIAGKAVEIVAEAAMEGLPADEKAAAMAPVKAFTEKVSAGEVSAAQVMAVAKQFAEGPAVTAIRVRGFEAKHLEPSKLSDKEKEVGKLNASRFVRGVVKDKIGKDKIKELNDILTEQVEQKQNGKTGTVTKLKATLTTEEIQKCLKLMKDAADKAKIKDKKYKNDLPAMIQKAIDAGMAAESEGSTSN